MQSPTTLRYHLRDQEDDLVRQLLESDDVDEVINRMERSHYRHIEPVIKSLSSFEGTAKEQPQKAPTRPNSNNNNNNNIPMQRGAERRPSSTSAHPSSGLHMPGIDSNHYYSANRSPDYSSSAAMASSSRAAAAPVGDTIGLRAAATPSSVYASRPSQQQQQQQHGCGGGGGLQPPPPSAGRSGGGQRSTGVYEDPMAYSRTSREAPAGAGRGEGNSRFMPPPPTPGGGSGEVDGPYYGRPQQQQRWRPAESIYSTTTTPRGYEESRRLSLVSPEPIATPTSAPFDDNNAQSMSATDDAAVAAFSAPRVSTRLSVPDPTAMMEESLDDPSSNRIARQLQLLRNYRELAELCSHTSNPSTSLLQSLPSEQLARMQAEQIRAHSQGREESPITVNNNYFFNPPPSSSRQSNNNSGGGGSGGAVGGGRSSPQSREGGGDSRYNSNNNNKAQAPPGRRAPPPPPPPLPADEMTHSARSMPLQSPGVSSSPDSPVAKVPIVHYPDGACISPAPSVPSATRSPRGKSRRLSHRLDNRDTNTATTEEAGTSYGEEEEYQGDCLDDDEDAFMQQPPRIIEREQHRRPPQQQQQGMSRNNTLNSDGGRGGGGAQSTNDANRGATLPSDALLPDHNGSISSGRRSSPSVINVLSGQQELVANASQSHRRSSTHNGSFSVPLQNNNNNSNSNTNNGGGGSLEGGVGGASNRRGSVSAPFNEESMSLLTPPHQHKTMGSPGEAYGTPERRVLDEHGNPVSDDGASPYNAQLRTHTPAEGNRSGKRGSAAASSGQQRGGDDNRSHTRRPYNGQNRPGIAGVNNNNDRYRRGQQEGGRRRFDDGYDDDDYSYSYSNSSFNSLLRDPLTGRSREFTPTKRGATGYDNNRRGAPMNQRRRGSQQQQQPSPIRGRGRGRAGGPSPVNRGRGRGRGASAAPPGSQMHAGGRGGAGGMYPSRTSSPQGRQVIQLPDGRRVVVSPQRQQPGAGSAARLSGQQQQSARRTGGGPGSVAPGSSIRPTYQFPSFANASVLMSTPTRRGSVTPLTAQQQQYQQQQQLHQQQQQLQQRLQSQQAQHRPSVGSEAANPSTKPRLQPGLLYGSLLPKAKGNTAMVVDQPDSRGRVRSGSVNPRNGDLYIHGVPRPEDNEPLYFPPTPMRASEAVAAHHYQPQPHPQTPPISAAVVSAPPQAAAAPSSDTAVVGGGDGRDVQQLVWKSGSSGCVMGRNMRIPSQPRAKISSHYRVPPSPNPQQPPPPQQPQQPQQQQQQQQQPVMMAMGSSSIGHGVANTNNNAAMNQSYGTIHPVVGQQQQQQQHRPSIVMTADQVRAVSASARIDANRRPEVVNSNAQRFGIASLSA